MSHIACNLIYNNGGQGELVGFHGRCTLDIIKYNVEKGPSRWCSQTQCSCRSYYDSGFAGGESEFPCNESETFFRWQWSAGEKFSDGSPFPMRYIEPNRVAIFTTVFPYEKEAERKIVGVMLINQIDEANNKIYGSSVTGLRLSLNTARALNFWEYYKNSKPEDIKWSQKRFRYLSNEQSAAILHDIHTICITETDRYKARSILRASLPLFEFVRPPVSGALLPGNVRAAMLKRKYGGGESQWHKALKEWIALHPERIGIEPSSVISSVEHAYISGDMVDILFSGIAGSSDTVVEIELDNVMPGIHQAIKYRALRCSQLGLPLDSNKVNATIVAWQFSQTEIETCEKYGINYYQYRI